MNILLHTIALEPARWTPQRVSRPLVELLPQIAAAGFGEIEIFEPHLTDKVVSEEIKEALANASLTPVLLSSYLNLNPAETSDSDLDAGMDVIAERVGHYRFEAVRLFPGLGMNPADAAAVAVFTDRVRRLADRVPAVEILLETHDGSLADDPKVITAIVEDLTHPRIGLLFQPTSFLDEEAIREQLRIEKPHIRHIHLQNRLPDLSFAIMHEGIIPWAEILHELEGAVDATLEFVPMGLCHPDRFDLKATLAQARAESDSIRAMLAQTA